MLYHAIFHPNSSSMCFIIEYEYLLDHIRQCLYADILDEVIRKMHPITHSSLIQSWIYNNINCNFVICQRCFWNATVFNLVKKENRDNNERHNRTIKNCPICSTKNISIISIPVDDNNNYK